MQIKKMAFLQKLFAVNDIPIRGWALIVEKNNLT